MKPIALWAWPALAGTALALAALLAVITGPIQTAQACTGNPISWTFAESEQVFEGRVVAAVERPDKEDTTFRWFDIRVLVTVAHRGVEVGQELAFHSRLPKPGVPVMCQLSPNLVFDGKYVVAAASAHPEDEFRAWHFAYLEADAAGPAYEFASVLARAAVGADPSLPALAISRTSETCGATVLIRGSRFEPGVTYSLAYPGAWGEGTGEPPRVAADSAGRFLHSFSPGAPGNETCELYGYVEALPIVNGEPAWGHPVAMGRLSDDLPIAPLPPDVGDTPPATTGTEPHALPLALLAALALGLAAAAQAISRIRRSTSSIE